MAQIFLSYSRTDIAIVQNIRSKLTDAGFDVWTDERLEFGTRIWEHEITKAIEQSHCLVVVLSPHAKNSEWVLKEVIYAETIGLRVIPILVQGDDKTAIPIRLVTTQRIDARSDLEEGLVKLVGSIRQYLGKTKPVSPYESFFQTETGRFKITVEDHVGVLVDIFSALHNARILVTRSDFVTLQDGTGTLEVFCHTYLPTQDALADLVVTALRNVRSVRGIQSWRGE